MVYLFAPLLAAAALAATTTNAPPTPSASPPPAGAPAVAPATPSAAPATPIPAAAAALSNGIDRATGFAVGVEPPEDPTERAYRELLEKDDAAQEEMDGWIREADAQGAAADAKALQKRIDARIAEVDKLYREFLGKNPEHARARIAFGSFLSDTGREGQAREQWEKALQLDPKNPAIYNNLAGIYGHSGPVTNAFSHYEKAIELSPKEPVYYWNFATVVFLFRRDVMEYYAITDEQKVFDKALGLYTKALELDPHNFILASDLAQTYYLIKPPRYDDALAAWKKASELAADGLEREGVHSHLGRILVDMRRFDEARAELALVTNDNYASTKERLMKKLKTLESSTNAPTTGAPR